MSESLPPLSGLLAGKYEVQNLIGRGGMGSVWLGKHVSLGTQVAIKFVDPEYAESKEARSRFDTEARAAATIRSKHAIHIYDHGLTEDGRPYIVMELLVGEALDKRLEKQGRLSLQETARILGQVCRALQRAHDAGIIHRDLKPENIFLVHTPDDDEEIAKVLDFGIAKIKPSPGDLSATSSTKTGAVLGTPYYMSPEQARGLRNIDHRTDLWSLGVIAYKCLTGVLPFDGESVGDLLVKICTSPLPVPSDIEGVPPVFDAWFARALERDLSGRFARATELADALAMVAGVTVRRGPPSGELDLRLPGGTIRNPPSSRDPVPLPGAAITSAPFTTGPRPSRSSRGMWLGLFLTAGVAASVGVLGVMRFTVPPPRPGASSPSIGALAAPPPTVSAALSPAPSVAISLPAVTSASAASSPTSETPPSSKHPVKPGGASSTPTKAVPAGVRPYAAPAPRPTPVRSSPAAADPGY